MKAAIMYKERDVRVAEIPEPEINAEEVLIRVKSVALCGSEIHIFEHFETLLRKYGVENPGPFVIGHEYAGAVVKVGSAVKRIKVGDRVVVDPDRACGTCYACRMTEKNGLCENPIAYLSACAEYAKAHEDNAYLLPANVGYDEATQTEPLSCAIRGLGLVRAKSGESFVILGAGPTGLIFVQLAKLAGASIIAVVAQRKESLEKAKEFGATVLINSKESDPVAEVKKATDGRGASVVIEAIGRSKTMRWAVDMAGKAGKICFFGVPFEEEVTLPCWDFYGRELLLVGANRHGGTFQRALDLITHRRVNLNAIISHKMSIEEVPQAFEIVTNPERKHKEQAIKIVINP